MERTEAESVGNIIDKILSESNLTDEFAMRRAAYVWADVVGPVISHQTSKRFVVNGVLHVFINSAPLKNELEYSRDRLVSLINQAIGKEVITNIVIH